MSIAPQPSHLSRFGASTPPIILPFALRFCVNDFAPHFGQRTSPVSLSTFVDFITPPYDALEAAVPRMTHPNSKQTIDVSPAQVSLYKAQGWVEKPAAKKAQAKPKK